MARSGNLDPLTRYRYTVYIEVDGDASFFKKLAFQTVTQPRIDLTLNEYPEGGRHLNPHSITDKATYTAVSLRRGKSFSKDFANWMGAVFKAHYGDENGSSANYRATVTIDHHDRRGNVVKKYVLQNARPSAYIPSSNFDSMDDEEVSIEVLTLSYEGMLEFSLDQNFLGGILGSAASGILGRLTGDNPQTLPAGPISES